MSNENLDQQDALNNTLKQIDVLSSRYEKTLNLETAGQIFELRKKAGETIVASKDGLPLEPPVAPQLFKDFVGIPEIVGDELSVETMSAGLLNKGALLVRGLLSRPKLISSRREPCLI